MSESTQGTVANTDDSNSNDTGDNSQVPQARVFRVDLRNYYGFWDKPTWPELHQAIDTTFPMECPIIEEGRQNYRCSYTIHLNRLVYLSRPSCYSLQGGSHD